MARTDELNSFAEGYTYIKLAYEATGNDAKNIADSFKLLWENLKTQDVATAATYARNLASQARETAEFYNQLAEACDAAARCVD